MGNSAIKDFDEKEIRDVGDAVADGSTSKYCIGDVSKTITEKKTSLVGHLNGHGGCDYYDDTDDLVMVTTKRMWPVTLTSRSSGGGKQSILLDANDNVIAIMKEKSGDETWIYRNKPSFEGQKPSITHTATTVAAAAPKNTSENDDTVNSSTSIKSSGGDDGNNNEDLYVFAKIETFRSSMISASNKAKDIYSVVDGEDDNTNAPTFKTLYVGTKVPSMTKFYCIIETADHGTVISKICQKDSSANLLVEIAKGIDMSTIILIATSLSPNAITLGNIFAPSATLVE